MASPTPRRTDSGSPTDAPDGTTEVGGVSPAAANPRRSSAAIPTASIPNDFVAFGSKALVLRARTPADFDGLWSTDGTTSRHGRTRRPGQRHNDRQARHRTGTRTTSPPSATACCSTPTIPAAAFRACGSPTARRRARWRSAARRTRRSSIPAQPSFEANNFIAARRRRCCSARDKRGRQRALGHATARRRARREIGGVEQRGDRRRRQQCRARRRPGQRRAVRRTVFFSGPDTDGDAGLWVTDGTAAGTTEVGGLGDAGLTASGQHPAASGSTRPISTVNGQKVLFNGEDALGFQELWASDGTAIGTYEIGGEGVGGLLPTKAATASTPSRSSRSATARPCSSATTTATARHSGKPTLWVTRRNLRRHQRDRRAQQSGRRRDRFDRASTSPTRWSAATGLAYFIGAERRPAIGSCGRPTARPAAPRSSPPPTATRRRPASSRPTKHWRIATAAAAELVSRRRPERQSQQHPGENVDSPAPTMSATRSPAPTARSRSGRAGLRHRRRRPDHAGGRRQRGQPVANQRQQGCDLRHQGRDHAQRRAGQRVRRQEQHHLRQRHDRQRRLSLRHQGTGTTSPAPAARCI